MRLKICNICLVMMVFFTGGLFTPSWGGSASFEVETANPMFESIEAIFGVTPFNEALLVWPVDGKHNVSSRYGYREHPFSGKQSLHRGLDIAARRGTPIVSIAPGKVKFVGYKRGYGRMVQIEHTSGWVSTYAHASITVVKKGQPVLAGQMIAKVGATGYATGPHLHLEIHRAGQWVDPLPLLREKLVVMTP